MSSKLVIVESPAKAKTIGKILGKDYIIKASYGHIRDLPEHTFGVDIEHGFLPQYEESKARSKNLSELKKAAAGVSDIFLASDPDREGEAIAWHLYEVLHKYNKKADFKRVAFHEITRSAIERAFRTPGKVNMSLVDAQQARRVLDRIVGYMISPLLWSRIERGVSAGRVQSVALRLVCEREREIRAFVPKEYWNFNALFSAGKDLDFSARLFKIDNEKFEINNGTDADALLKDVRSAKSWMIDSVETLPRKRYAAAPFITSTLQQAASSALGFSASSTMRIAQQLYEGVDLGSGSVGLITYMRTDSVNLSVEATTACRAFISKHYGAQFVPPKTNIYRTKSTAQAAHEAIRPTDVNITPESIRNVLEPMQYKLYKLIWNRFVACQMAPAEQLRTTVDVGGTGIRMRKKYTFRAVATVVTFPGFLKVYNIEEEGVKNEDGESNAEALAVLREKMSCGLKDVLSEQKFTDPPPRFSEATLIKELESNGIGRPSTYATIVNTIQERKYVEKEKGKLIPSDLGFRINDYLVSTLPDLIQVGFTADMENRLDSIEEGTLQWTGMLEDFYKQFSQWLAAAKQAGAPDAGKASALLKMLAGIKTWQQPQKVGKRTFDDKKFFESVLESSKKKDQTTVLSSKQWEALLNFAIKYASQLKNLDAVAQKYGFTGDVEKARERAEEKLRKHEEFVQRRENAEKAAPPEYLAKLFTEMDKITFNPPEKRGRRVYDDRIFFNSLKEQSETGRILSEKQIAALLKMASRYSGSIADYQEIVSKFPAAVPADAPATGTSAPAYVPPAMPAADLAELKSVIEKMARIKTWAEPVKRGKRTYDDKDFYLSIANQFEQGKTLSPRQVAALMKLAGKYGISSGK